MVSRKLSESDKKTILDLYRKTGETSSTLASQYGVSTSTVSRILKSNLPEEEYEALIQQKRGGRASEVAPVEQGTVETAVESLSETVTKTQPPASGRRLRKRSSAAPRASEPSPDSQTKDFSSQEEDVPVAEIAKEIVTANKVEDDYAAEERVIHEMLGEDLLDQDDDDDLDEDDLDEDEDDLDDEDLDGDLEEGRLFVRSKPEGKAFVQVLPLNEASLPKTCYLVVDRSAELIARPLREFGDLGQIPEAEVLEKTLPIFDNHRVAKRYSNPRTQRVIKLPDGRVLQKTSAHLQAKGITRVLIDGQVYSLAD